MEKFLFAKVEAWVFGLVGVVGAAGLMAFGAIVTYVGEGGEKLGGFGDFVYGVAKVPSNALAILKGKAAGGDFSAKELVIAYPRGAYQPVDEMLNGPATDAPIVWKSAAWDEGAAPIRAPLALMFRMNKQKDEHLAFFDERRNFIRSFPVKAESFSGKFSALSGNSPPFVLDDGTVVVFPSGGDGLYRKSLCGDILWSVPGLYHHSFSVADGKLGVLGLPEDNLTAEDHDNLRWNRSEILNIIDIETGRIERSVTLNEIAAANAGIVDPFSWRLWRNTLNEYGVLAEDVIHLNKLEILPEALADDYPDFPAGAWMVSSRNFNLIAVIHPETLEILWHSQGHTEGQHDPEFVGDNRILVFNNALDKNVEDAQSPRNFSSVREVNVSTGAWRDVYNAVDAKGFTPHSGEIDFTPNGGLIMTLTKQGRYLEVSPDGDVLTDFINANADGGVYWTKHAQYLSPKQLETVSELSCEN
ncbi:MAG: arylsulfotransferase family protein [Pseudomonadota bacterium]